METYFNQLKDKHNSPQKAYKEYILSKTLLANYYCSDNASDFIKEAFNLYGKLNSLAVAFIENESFFDICQSLGIDGGIDAKRKFIKENSKYMNFLGIDDSLQRLLLTTYHRDINDVAKEITWDSLEKIMISESNNDNKLSDVAARFQLQKICNEYAIESVTIGKVASDINNLKNIGVSCAQLSEAIECDKKQVGSNVFNLFYDNEDCNASGYSTQYSGRQKIFLYSKTSSNAFAHEWMHGVDNIIAKQKKLSVDLASNDENITNSFSSLLNKMKNNIDDDELIKTYMSDKTVSFINKTVDVVSKLNVWRDDVLLKKIITDEHLKIQSNLWDKNELKNKLNEQKTENNKPNHQYYIISELELLNNITNSKKINTNIFMEYAKIMDENLKSFNWLEKDEVYSTTNHELIARSFETLVDVKLKNKNIKNIISSTNENSYIPSSESLEKYMLDWNGALGVIRDSLNELYPIKKSPLDKLNNIRKKETLIKNHHHTI